MPIPSRLPLFKSIAFIASLSLLGVSGLPLQGQEAKAKGKPAQNKKGAAPTAASLVKDMKASVAFIAKNSKDINTYQQLIFTKVSITSSSERKIENSQDSH